MFGSSHCVAMLSGWLILAATSVTAYHHPTPLLITQPYYGFFYFPYRHDPTGKWASYQSSLVNYLNYVSSFQGNLWIPQSTAETFRLENTAGVFIIFFKSCLANNLYFLENVKETSEMEGRTPGRKVYSDHPSGSYASGNHILYFKKSSWSIPTSKKFLLLTLDENHIDFLRIETLETEGRIRPSLRNAFPNFVSSVTSPLNSFFTNPLTFGLLDGTPCTSPNAEAGICTNSRLCSSYGGRSSGSCNSFGTVCCISMSIEIRPFVVAVLIRFQILLFACRHGDPLWSHCHAEQYVLAGSDDAECRIDVFTFCSTGPDIGRTKETSYLSSSVSINSIAFEFLRIYSNSRPFSRGF